jgi:hypothetical protein
MNCVYDKYEECGDGQQVSNSCTGNHTQDTSSCEDCLDTTCGFNQYLGRNCQCLQCSIRSCLPGQFLSACSGTTDHDTSSCEPCLYFISDDGPNHRPCAADYYMRSQCVTGSDSRDVSHCAQCAIHEEANCANNQYLQRCIGARLVTDESLCIPCDPKVNYYYLSTGCYSAACRTDAEARVQEECTAEQVVVGCVLHP